MAQNTAIAPRKWTLTLSLFALAVAGITALPLRAADQKTLQATINEDEENISRDLSFGLRLAPAYRDAAKAEVLPRLQKHEADCQRILDDSSASKGNNELYVVVTEAERAALGDDAGASALATRAADKNAAKAADGKAGEILLHWYNAEGSPADQAKVLDEMEALTKAQPKNSDVAYILDQMIEDGSAPAALQARGSDILDAMPAGFAKSRYASKPNQVGKPLAIQAKTLDGQFDSAKFKGKVVMVEFWATWCAPCIEEYPIVEKAYQTYHPQGLEGVGLDGDVKLTALQSFMTGHPGMTWPQSYGGGATFHPLAKKFGVTAVPTIYLIDKNGILRSMHARYQLDILVPKLLAESPAGT